MAASGDFAVACWMPFASYRFRESMKSKKGRKAE
jgi:hypothetical protein